MVDPFVFSLAVCASYVVLFVGLLYVRAAGREDRDSEAAIIARFQSVAVTCVLSGVIFFFCLPVAERSLLQLAHYTGLVPSVVGVLVPLGATMLLFLGPLVQELIDENEPLQHLSFKRVDLIWLRNFVVAPLAEEWVFRGCMVPVLFFGHFSVLQLIFFPPLFFGVAHAHHVLHVLRERGATISQAVMGVLFQVFYTTVFGSMAAFYFVSTGSLWGAILSHAFCNMMGFPDFGGIRFSRKPLLVGGSYAIGLLSYIGVVMWISTGALGSSTFWRV